MDKPSGNYMYQLPNPHFGAETLDGPFSSVSTPIFASKYAFFSDFRDLYENHFLASKSCKFLQKKRRNKFCRNFGNLEEFRRISSKILTNTNTYLDAKIGVDTAEIQSSKVCLYLSLFRLYLVVSRPPRRILKLPEHRDLQ